MWSRIWDRWWSRRLDRISTGGMPGGQSADLGVQAADAIDKRVGGVVSGLSDFCVNLADMIAQFTATEDANTVAFQNIAHSSGVN